MEIEIPCFETAGVPSQYVESTGSMIGKSTRGLAFALKTLASTIAAHVYCGCESKDAGVYIDVRDSSSSYVPYTGSAASMIMSNSGRSICEAVHGKHWVPIEEWTEQAQHDAFNYIVSDCFSEWASTNDESAIVSAFQQALDDYDYLTMEGSSLCCCKDLADMEVSGSYVGIFEMQLGKGESEKIFVLFDDVRWNWIDEKGRNNSCRAIKLVRCVFHWRCISHGRRYSNPAFVKAEGNAMLMQDGFHREWSLYADDLPTATLRTLSQMENDLYDKNREIVLLLDSMKSEGDTLDIIEQMYATLAQLDEVVIDHSGVASADDPLDESPGDKAKARKRRKDQLPVKDRRAVTLQLIGFGVGLTQIAWAAPSGQSHNNSHSNNAVYVDLDVTKPLIRGINSDESALELAVSLFTRPGGLIPKKQIRLANIIWSKISRLLSDYHVFRKVGERKDAANPTLPKITKAEDGRYSLRKRPLGVEFSPPLLVLGMGGDYYLESASRLLLAVSKGAATAGGYSGEVFFSASKITERPGHCTHVESTLKDPMMRMRTSGITSGSIGYLVHPIKPAVVDMDIKVAQVISSTEVAAAAQSIATTELLEKVARSQMENDSIAIAAPRKASDGDATRAANERLLSSIMERRANETDIRLDWVVTRTARNYTQRSVEHISCAADSRFYYSSLKSEDALRHPVDHFDSRYFPVFDLCDVVVHSAAPRPQIEYSQFLVRIEAPGSSVLSCSSIVDYRGSINELLENAGAAHSGEDSESDRTSSCQTACSLDEILALAAISRNDDEDFRGALSSFVLDDGISYMVRKLYLSKVVKAGRAGHIICPVAMYIGVNIDGVWLLFNANGDVSGAVCTMSFADAAAVLTTSRRGKHKDATHTLLADKRFSDDGLMAVAKTVCMSPFSPYRTPSEIRKKITTNSVQRESANVPTEWRFVDCKEKLPSEPQASEFVVLKGLGCATQVGDAADAAHRLKVKQMYNFNSEVI